MKEFSTALEEAFMRLFREDCRTAEQIKAKVREEIKQDNNSNMMVNHIKEASAK